MVVVDVDQSGIFSSPITEPCFPTRQAHRPASIWAMPNELDAAFAAGSKRTIADLEVWQQQRQQVGVARDSSYDAIISYLKWGQQQH